MATEHIVEPGEHISAIAEQHGFGSFETIWSFSKNAKLRSRRKDPHQLLAGDVLVIPPKQPKSMEVATGRRHRFVLSTERLLLRIQLADIFGDPIANEAGILTVDSTELAVSSDGEGVVEVRIPRNSRAASLNIAGYTLELEVGGLDPPEEPSGRWGRFVNLGVWVGSADDSRDDPDLVQVATELFQQRQGEPPSGTDDGTLAAALAEAHDDRVA